MPDAGITDYLDADSIPVAIGNATSAPVGGWTGEISRGQGFWDFVLVATDAEDASVHGFVTDGSELAIACVHIPGGSRVVALEPPAPPASIDDAAAYAAWMAGVLAGAIDAPHDARPPAVMPFPALLPAGEAWDARFVIKPAEGEIYPKPDGLRSYLAEGAASLATREPDEPVEFWFDAPHIDDPHGTSPEDAYGPYLFEAWPRGDAEAGIVLGFFGGSMGPDEIYGWTAWNDDAVWFVAYDAPTGASSITKAAKPVELREREPDGPAWWLALARFLVVLQPLAVEDPLYAQR